MLWPQLNATPIGQWEPRDQVGGFDCYSSTEGSVLARFVQTPTEASGEAIVPTPAAASSLCHEAVAQTRHTDFRL